MNELKLAGCTPEPIGAYLKALGILRLVAEQADAGACGWWQGEYFHLRTKLDRDTLVRFFLDEYAPTPIIAPWNGGSGFFPGTSSAGLDAIVGNQSQRFRPYRMAITTARTILSALDVTHESLKRDKQLLIARLRDELADECIAWLDAVLIMTHEGLSFPPLLGTGGNDGRLDFTNNQMQHLASMLIDRPASGDALLRGALFGQPTPALHDASIGQFSPGQAGASNSAPGFKTYTRVNPWDFVLLLEGALLLSSSVTRRLEWTRPGSLSYPFSVRASGSGYGSASEVDESDSRHELWTPLWESPAGLAEIRTLFAEGRMHVGVRPARTGIDFARAISTLAIDRGITSFVRYAFHKRNGKAYFATPLERWQVLDKPNDRVLLLQAIDEWLERLRAAAHDGPGSIRVAHRQLEIAILELCRADSALALQEVVIALGGVEHALARSHAFTDAKRIPPVPLLSAEWLGHADDRSAEYRLASAIASTGVREHMVPFRLTQPRSWQPAGDPRVNWGERSLVQNLIAVLRRRELQAEGNDDQADRAWVAVCPAALPDIEAFIEGRIDDSRIEALLCGLACIDWRRVRSFPTMAGHERTSSALFALLKLVHDRDITPQVRLPRCPPLFARAAAGNAFGATTHAIRRLRGSGLKPIPEAFREDPERTVRTTAALLFPVSSKARTALIGAVLVPKKADDLEPETIS